MVTEIEEPGSVVQLRSGGLLMTVVGRDEDGRVLCTYFNTKLEQVTLGLEPFLLKVNLDAVNNITVGGGELYLIPSNTGELQS